MTTTPHPAPAEKLTAEEEAEWRKISEGMAWHSDAFARLRIFATLSASRAETEAVRRERDDLRDAVNAAWWIESRLVVLDHTVIFGRGDSTLDRWETMREELHSRRGSVAVWPTGPRWSLYCTLDGALRIDAFADVEAAKRAGEAMLGVSRLSPDDALRALDYEAASGEVTPEVLTHEQERIERMLATAEEDGVDLLLMPDEVVALRRLLGQVRDLRAKDAPLLSAAARRKALEEAASVAYTTPEYVAGWGSDGAMIPGSPYDRGRFDAAAAIRALKKESV